MGFLDLSEIQSGITKPEICEVIFRRGINVFLSLDIISNRTVDQERIAKAVDIPFDRIRADRFVFYALEGGGKLTRVSKRSYSGRKDVQKLLQFRFIADKVLEKT